MKQEIRRLLFIDCFVMLISMVTLWAMVIFTMTAVSSITPGTVLPLLVKCSALLICLFATASLAAVFGHIRRNRESIYSEDILAARQQK